MACRGPSGLMKCTMGPIPGCRPQTVQSGDAEGHVELMPRRLHAVFGTGWKQTVAPNSYVGSRCILYQYANLPDWCIGIVDPSNGMLDVSIIR